MEEKDTFSNKINDYYTQNDWNKENGLEFVEDLLSFKENCENVTVSENCENSINLLMSDFNIFGINATLFGNEILQHAQDNYENNDLNVKQQFPFLLSHLAAEELEANKRMKKTDVKSESVHNSNND